jgi:hypothetical protein
MPSSNDPSPIARLNLNKNKVDEIIGRKRANVDPAKAAIYAAMSDDELWEENNRRGGEELPKEMNGELFDLGFRDEVLKANLKLE